MSEDRLKSIITESINGDLKPVIWGAYAALVVVVTTTASIAIMWADMRNDIKSALGGAEEAKAKVERLEATVQSHEKFFFFMNKIDFFKYQPKTNE